jgi:hypothetical protein
VTGRGQLKWYNPFVVKNCDYVAPSITGLDEHGGHEPSYQRRRGKFMEWGTRKFMRGAQSVLLPPGLAVGFYGAWQGHGEVRKRE